MGLTKIDRSTTAKIQEVSGIPGSSTRGNIAISDTGPALYFKYGDFWYSVSGGSGGAGVFEPGAGTNSAKRSGVATSTAAGNYAFSMGYNVDATGNYSAGVGTTQHIEGAYCFAAGANHYIYSTADYNATFGGSHTILSGASYNLVSGHSISVGSSSFYNIVSGDDHNLDASTGYNIVGGDHHTLDGSYNTVSGSYNTASDTFYSLIAGRNHTITYSTYCLIAGRENEVQENYGMTWGRLNENDRDHALVGGQYAKAIWEGARHFAGVQIDGATTGSSMGIDGLCLSGRTSGSSTVTLTLDSADGSGTNPLYCPDGHTIIAGVRIVCMYAGSGGGGGLRVWDFNLFIERHDPATFNVYALAYDGGGGATTPIVSKGTVMGTIATAEDAVNSKALLRCTGVPYYTVNWTAHIYKAICVKGTYHYGGS
jgi:hypothetical protein